MAVNTIPSAYDPRSVVLIIGEQYPYDYAANTKIVVAKTESLMTPVAGVDGDVAIAVNANNLGTITISLKSTSGFNKTLMNWCMSYDNEDSSAYFFKVDFYDPASNLGVSSYGWIEEQPDFSLGSEIGQLDWVIGISDARFANIGNVTISDVLTEATTD